MGLPPILSQTNRGKAIRSTISEQMGCRVRDRKVSVTGENWTWDLTALTPSRSASLMC